MNDHDSDNDSDHDTDHIICGAVGWSRLSSGRASASCLGSVYPIPIHMCIYIYIHREREIHKWSISIAIPEERNKNAARRSEGRVKRLKIVVPIPRFSFVLPKRGQITRMLLPPEGWEGYGPVLPKVGGEGVDERLFIC